MQETWYSLRAIASPGVDQYGKPVGADAQGQGSSSTQRITYSRGGKKRAREAEDGEFDGREEDAGDATEGTGINPRTTQTLVRRAEAILRIPTRGSEVEAGRARATPLHRQNLPQSERSLLLVTMFNPLFDIVVIKDVYRVRRYRGGLVRSAE